MYVMGLIYLTIEKGEIPSCLCRLPVIYITFWINVYSIIKVFSFPIIFVEGISLLGDFVFSYISPSLYTIAILGVLFPLKTAVINLNHSITLDVQVVSYFKLTYS